MTVDATIFGADLSKYDSPQAVQGKAFVILNAEDPGLADKLAVALALGLPWGIYLWVYPGVRWALQWAMATVEALGHGKPPLGYWMDYEQAGVTPDQLVDAFVQLDAAGEIGGYYSSPNDLDHGPFLDRWWWRATYPGANDGSYPGLASLTYMLRSFVMWQFTSTNGTLDQDGVTDPAWWASVLTTVAPSSPSPEDDDMPCPVYLVNLDGSRQWGLSTPQGIMPFTEAQAPGEKFGRPGDLARYQSDNPTMPQPVNLPPAVWARGRNAWDAAASAPGVDSQAIAAAEGQIASGVAALHAALGH